VFFDNTREGKNLHNDFAIKYAADLQYDTAYKQTTSNFKESFMSDVSIGVYFDLRYFNIIYNYYLVKNIVFNIENFFNYIQYEVSIHLSIPMDKCTVNKNEVHFYIGGTANSYGERNLESALVRARLGENIHRLALGYGKEKGVDTRLILDAYKSATTDRYDVLGLITGDADFVPLVDDIKNELHKSVFLFFWDEESTNIKTAQDLIDNVTKPFAMHEILTSRINTKNPFAKNLLQPKVLTPIFRSNDTIPDRDLRTLLIETANECTPDENGWILASDFGLILKKVKKYDPKENGERLADLFQTYPNLFDVRPEPPLAVRLRKQVQSSAKIFTPIQTPAEASISVPQQLTPREMATDYEDIIVTINQELNFGYIRSPWKYDNKEMNNYAFIPSDIQNPGNKELNKGTKVKFNLADDPYRSLKYGASLYKAVNVVIPD
jgi:uncharacterized LabA/DUF88 family protein